MQSQILILYTSKTGFTKCYAQWLGERLSAPVCSLESRPLPKIEGCGFVLCGGGIYGQQLSGLKKFRRLEKQYPNTKFIYFATGMRPKTDEVLQGLIDYNFSKAKQELPQPPFFYLPGGLDLEKLDSASKTMLSLYKSMLKRRRDLSKEDANMLEILSHSSDVTNALELGSLLEYLRQQGISIGEGG